MNQNPIVKQFYDTFYLPGLKKNAALKKQELYQIYRTPKKDTEFEKARTNRQSIEKGNVYQADCLYMPEDPETGDKYILVVCDTAFRGLTDAYPFKILNSQSIIRGFNHIFKKNKILKSPKYIIKLDKGTEFKNEQVEKYFNEKSVFVDYTETGRSRQNALVEYRNKVIAKSLFMRQTAQELLTSMPSLHWSKDLDKLIKIINQHALKAKINKFSDIPKIDKDTVILSIGTPVRIQLDKPREVYENKKLNGNFRITDTRWSVDIFTISNIILDGDEPPLYRVTNIYGKEMKPAYTRNQLQIVQKDEQEPPKTVIRGEPTQYVVKAITEKKKIGNRTYYKCVWKGFVGEDTFEPYSTLKKHKYIKHLIDKFNNI